MLKLPPTFASFTQPFTWQDALLLVLFTAVLQPFADALLLPTHNYSFYQYFTAHFVHLNWQHWALNMAVLLFLPFLLPLVPRWHFWLICLLFAPAMSFIFIFANQLTGLHISSYVGFSGVLHGIYLFFGLYFLYLRFVVRKVNFTHTHIYFSLQALVIVLAIFAKVTIESYTQPSFTENLIKAKVVHAAHMNGVVLAVIYSFIMVIINKMLNKKN